MCTQLLPSNLYYDITENNIHPQDILEYVCKITTYSFLPGKFPILPRQKSANYKGAFSTCIVLYHTAQQHYSGVLPRSCLSQIHPYQFAQQASYTSVPVPHICSAVLHTLAAKG
jgi:hypothetical protein